MPSTYDTVWSLWPSINEMARSLSESPSLLIREREAGCLPDERHDRMLVARASYNGRQLSASDLRAARSRGSYTKEKSRRKKAIGDFYEKMGGGPALAKKIGAGGHIMRLAKCRAYFPRSWKYEIMRAAEESKVDLDEELFEPMK